MTRQQTQKTWRVADSRRRLREDTQEEQERPEIRKDLRHWFRER